MVVRAWSGLMSRVRMLYDAYQLVKKYEKEPKLVIFWELEDCCNIRYESVFSEKQFSDIRVEVINIDNMVPWKSRSLKRLIREFRLYELFLELRHRGYIQKLRRKHIKGCSVVSYNDIPEIIDGDFSRYMEWKEDNWRKIKDICEKNEKLYINCYESFTLPRDVSNISNTIKFKENCVEKAEEIVSEKMVGIHIRRTDHTVAKELSPIGLFFQKIEEEISKDNSVRFFVSTDDREVESSLIQKYGDRIVVQPQKKWGRISEEEMLSGIVDCLCLSRCIRIYGSFSSQFSGFAAEYGEIPIEIVRKE